MPSKPLQLNRAVRFGDPRRDHSEKAFAYWYPFIGYPYQGGQTVDNTGMYSTSVADAIGPDGLLIAAGPGSILEIPIVMDVDCNYHLLSIRYTAWNPNHETIAIGSRERLLGAANSLQGGRSLFDASMNQRDPYWSYLDVSAYMVSSGARDLYGGMSREPLTGAIEENPIPLNAIQGHKDGMGSLRTAFQLTKGATVRLRFTSRFTASLRIHGHLFGYKITV